MTTVAAGSVSLDEASFLLDVKLDALQSDNFTLATLSFSGNNVGATTLGFGPVDLSDAAFPANTLLVDTFNTTSVTVESSTQQPVIPEPSTILFLGTGLVGLMVWRFRLLRY